MLHALYRCRAWLPSALSRFKALYRLPSSQRHTCHSFCGAMAPSFSSTLRSSQHSEGIVWDETTQAIGQSPNPFILASLLRTCVGNSDLPYGRISHILIIICAFDAIRFLQHLLLQMYCHCAAARDAFQVFSSMDCKDVASWNAMIGALIAEGQSQEGLCLYHRMHQEGVIPSRTTCMLLLPALSGHKSMPHGKQMHIFVLQIGCGSDIAVGTALVNMYGKCGSLIYCKEVFSSMPTRNVVTWTTMISLCAKHPEDMEAFHLFEKMLEEGVSPDRITFINVLSACSCHSMLKEGRKVHALVLFYGFEQNTSVVNALIHLYGRCKTLEEAKQVFESTHEKDVISFSSLSFAFAGHQYFTEALSVFNQMELSKVSPTKVTFLSVLSVLACQEALQTGENIHNRIVQRGLDEDVPLCNSLLNMYHKCGCAESAKKIFDKMLHRNVISWTTLIGIHAQSGECEKAFRTFGRMQEEGATPNKVTFVTMLDLCADKMALVEGRILHACIVDSSIECECILGTFLIKLYGLCNIIEDAQNVFDCIVEPVVLTWNSILFVYANLGNGDESLYLFSRMLGSGVLPDIASYGILLVACAKEGSVSLGKQVHVRAQSMEHEVNVVTATNIVNMYGKCGRPHFSQRLFDKMSLRNTISWTAMISLHIENGLEDMAFQLFAQMLEESILPNVVTFINVVTLCASQMALAGGKRVHASIMHSELGLETALVNALISMYGKCDSLEYARQTFNSLGEKNVVSWSCIIAAYAQHSHGMAALQIFEEMQLLGVAPNDITLVSVLDACANETCLPAGECIYIFLLYNTLQLSVVEGNSLINMYNKCGDAQGAEKTFTTMTQRDMATWSLLMGTYAEHGHGEEAVQLMERMMQEGLTPDEASITNFLSACGRCGQVDDGCYCFMLIIQYFCITTDCTCVVDLFGRAGLLEMAEVLIDHIPIQPTCMSFMALLSACRYQGDFSRGERLAQHVLELDATSTVPYYMLNHISSLIPAVNGGARVGLSMFHDAG